VSASILAPGTAISATIADELTAPVGELYTSDSITIGLNSFRRHLPGAGRPRYIASNRLYAARKVCP
jgi:hypothetical protein